jgi:hypothetical protein
MQNAIINFPNSYKNIVNKNSGKIASIVILYKKSDEERYINFYFTLNWINKYFKYFFEIIVIEQDFVQTLFLENKYSFITYHFLYNNKKFNRGWGFNCAIKHYCKTDIVALIDSDLILYKSFFDSIMMIYTNKYDIISPYNSIFYTTLKQKTMILSNIYNNCIKIDDQSSIKKYPTLSISGGILIIRKSVYWELGGFEEYKDYGAEDNAFDVYIKHFKGDRLLIRNEMYIHLFHDKNSCSNENIIAHFTKYYNDNLNINKKKLSLMIEHRKKYIGNIDLYRENNDYVNSIPPYNFINTT